MHLVITL